MTAARWLALYLKDHDAGTVATVSLLRRAAAGQAREEVRQALVELAAQAERDHAALRRVMGDLGVQPSTVRTVLALLAERLGRLKTNGRLASRSPLSDVLELEALTLATEDASMLWRTLERVSHTDARLDRQGTTQLVQRCTRRAERLRALWDQRAAEVLHAPATPRALDDPPPGPAAHIAKNRPREDPSMATPDLLAALAAQHGRIKALMIEVKSHHGEQRREAFTRLCRFLAIHEAAEQAFIHGPGAADLAEESTLSRQRIIEEHEAEVVIGRLESFDVDSSAFFSQFNSFQEAVVHHATAEETEEVPAFAATQQPEDIERIVDALAMVEEWSADTSAGAVVTVGGTFAEQHRSAIAAFGSAFAL